MKNKRLKQFPFLAPMGKTANFYVPAGKMNDPRYGRDGRTPGQMFEDFFVTSFGGFTHEESKIQGRWVGDNGNKLFSDEHQRYEVAFAGNRKAAEFFGFLADMCRLLEETSIYVTYGGSSWLVTPDSPLPAKETRKDSDAEQPG